MKLIVGLGNPGKEYENNRHNVGFMLVDYLAQLLSNNSPQFFTDKYLNAQIYKTDQIIFAKPNTFMNNSGVAVKQVVSRFMFHVLSDLIVAHDDLDIPLGKFKIQMANGPKLHNGIDSIEAHLKTKEFYRIRIGVENRDPERRIPGETYVLQNFTPEEMKIVMDTFPKIYERLQKEILR